MLRLAIALTLLVTACSDASPPRLGDPTEVVKETVDADRCAFPNEGCPCDPTTEPVYCGTVYRVSGDHVDCSKGYRTCNADGGWSACEGARIYMGD